MEVLKLAPRTVIGKNVKKLRRHGVVPVHLYGHGISAQTLQADSQALRRVLPRVGRNIALSVKTDQAEGESICFVREVQRHPLTEEVLHVDFLRVDVTQKMQAEVPIILTGAAPAIRSLGGVLIQPLLTIRVESLPMIIPVSIRVDISPLDDFEKAIHVSDISVDPSVTIITDATELIARVSPPRIEAVAAPVAEVAAEGAEDAPEGEEAADEEQEGEKPTRTTPSAERR